MKRSQVDLIKTNRVEISLTKWWNPREQQLLIPLRKYKEGRDSLILKIRLGRRG